ncbi:MAG TPA: heavy metal-binding domain-containing protein [Xanthomonadaceae bacterium]|jgi:uncharacterized protein YbjQ (UPF0145 family)
MSFLRWLTRKGDPESRAAGATSTQRQAEIAEALQGDRVPPFIAARLDAARKGELPWIATMAPGELRIAQSHRIRPITAVSATCWMHFGAPATEGHLQGWEAAVRRLREEALQAGANAVVDVKMRSIALGTGTSMEFSLVGTAVKVDGLPPSTDPVVATVPALELVKLLEAEVIPTGLVVGGWFEWWNGWLEEEQLERLGNVEFAGLTQLWEYVRNKAHGELRKNARVLGNGALAHVHRSELLKPKGGPMEFLAQHVVIATAVLAMRDLETPDDATFGDERRQRLQDIAKLRGLPVPHEFAMVVDMRNGATPLAGTARHHESYRQAAGKEPAE